MATLKLALKVDTNNPIVGDLFLTEKGKVRLTANLTEEVAQLLYTRFLFFKGEWWLEPTAGVPWLSRGPNDTTVSILGIKNSDANVSVILKKVITTCPGVSRLLSFSLNRVGRTISPVFACLLVDGAVLKSSDFGPMVLG